MKTKIITLALVALTILSCNDEKKSEAEISKEKVELNSETNSETQNETSKISKIENIQWTLSTMEGQDVAASNETDQVIHFKLNPIGKRISGFSGCNTFTGTYSLEGGNRIKFSKLAGTKKACPETAINEADLLNLFEMADNFTVNNGKLSLNKAKRSPLLEFKKYDIPNAPIVDKHWKLKTLNGKEVTMAENQKYEIFFTLKPQNNRVSGFAGCNNINGEYTLEKGDRISFKYMATTLKACPEVAVNESEFLKIFEVVDNYTIKDDVLSLNVGKRAPLAVFEAFYFE